MSATPCASGWSALKWSEDLLIFTETDKVANVSQRKDSIVTGYFVGIDMGGSTTKATAIDIQGKRPAAELIEIPTGASLGPTHAVKQMKTAADLALDAANVRWSDVLGVALATPGPAINGVLGKSPNLPALRGADLRGGLEQAIAAAGRHVAVIWVNDANAGTYADWATYGAPFQRGIIGLYPGTGLGAGFVDSRGNLLVGDHGAGAELGHLPLPFWLSGVEGCWRCGCGGEGCMETAASIAGLKNQLPDALKRKEFANHPLATSDRPLDEKVMSLRALAQNGDPLALHIFARQAKVLASMLVMGQVAFDAGIAVIGGGLTEPTATTREFRAWFLNELKTEFAKRAFNPDYLIDVVLTELGDMAQAVGAAELARHTYISKQ
jgi:glucokinase